MEMNFLQILQKQIADFIFAKIVGALICDERSIIGKHQSLIKVVLIVSGHRAQSESISTSYMDNCHIVVFLGENIWEIIERIAWEL